jgi:hypothetical protein
VGDIGARPVRHCDDEVLGELEAQAEAVLWMRMNSECEGQVREEEEVGGETKYRAALDARF